MSLEPVFDWLSKTFFFPKGETLSPLEVAVLKSFGDALATADRKKLDAQMSRCRGVFRQTSGMIVEFLAKGLRSEELFSNSAVELTAAFVCIDKPLGQGCAITLIRGRLARLNFVKSPLTKSKTVPVVGRATVVANVVSSGFVPLEDAVRKELPRWISSMHAQEYRRAKSDEQIRALLRFVGKNVPNDLELVLRTIDGIKGEGWEFSGTEGRQIIWPNKTCLQVLAESDESSWALCLRVGADAPEYLLLDQVDSDLESLGSEFEPALSSFLRKLGKYDM